MTGIYKFTNKENGHSYIGQSINIEQRLKDHRYRAFSDYPTNRDYNCAFYKALRLYGWENFEFEVLEECEKEQLNEREYYWISYYDTYHHGYNMTEGGDYIAPPQDGEKHPNHKLIEQDVYQIREEYAQHHYKDDVFDKYKHLIGKSGFHKIWNGSTWTKIHMDVYTEENKQFHRDVRNAHPGKGRSKFSPEEIKNIRQRFLIEDFNTLYLEYADRITKQQFKKMCIGQTYKFIK